jgi:hypothetical protein
LPFFRVRNRANQANHRGREPRTTTNGPGSGRSGPGHVFPAADGVDPATNDGRANLYRRGGPELDAGKCDPVRNRPDKTKPIFTRSSQSGRSGGALRMAAIPARTKVGQPGRDGSQRAMSARGKATKQSQFRQPGAGPGDPEPGRPGRHLAGASVGLSSFSVSPEDGHRTSPSGAGSR